jgi:tol-pal system protein YbgF
VTRTQRRAAAARALGAALLLAGCADFGPPIGGGAPPGPQEQRLQAIEARLGDVARKVENLNLAAQNQGLGRLENEVRGLRGEVERLRFELEASDRRTRELYQDLDRRLTRMENEGRARLALDSQLAQPPPVPPSQEEEAAYLATFEKLRAGRYDESVAGFRDQLQRWPEGQYADNAWYWQGEALYAKKDYDGALQSFKSLLERFPASAKVPDAMLKIGMAQIEKKQKAEAKATLQQLVEQHPDSSSADVARRRLEQLK